MSGGDQAAGQQTASTPVPVRRLRRAERREQILDAATRAFARAYVRRFGTLPPEARHTWPWTGVRTGRRPQPRSPSPHPAGRGSG